MPSERAGHGPVVRAQHLRLVAVSRGDHPLVTDEGASAEVVANVQGHLVGDGALRAGVAPHDLVVVVVIGGESNLSGRKSQFGGMLEGERDAVAGSCSSASLTSTAVTGGEEAPPSLVAISGRGSPSLCVSAGHAAGHPAGLQPRPLRGRQEDKDAQNPLAASECAFLTLPKLPPVSFITPLPPAALGAPDCQDGLA